MIFWDSSALVPLLIRESQSQQCAALLAQETRILVWTYTPTEILSAAYRRARGGLLSDSALTALLTDLAKFRKGWSEVLPQESVRVKAHRLLATHSLRAADALQLAAALVAFHDLPDGERFVTLDTDLARAAQREGFTVLPEVT